MTARSHIDPRLGFEHHRAELTGYCYRMLGSAFDADDAVQETLTRAWRAYDRFEGRSTVRTWLYRIATNVCFDMLRAGHRRALPVDLSEAGSADSPPGTPLAETTWIEPVPDALVMGGDPAEHAVARESVRLAFIAALQHLPPRQRAVLILRDVLSWRAKEVGGLLDMSVASVNSALQRAREKMAKHNQSDPASRRLSESDEEMLSRYLDAFERYDMDALTDLITEDATQSMPPYPLWLRGREEILAWWVGPGSACRGSRLVPTVANGSHAFGQYRLDPDGGYRPWSLQVLEVEDGRIGGFTFFLDTERVFPLFGLPYSLPPERS